MVLFQAVPDFHGIIKTFAYYIAILAEGIAVLFILAGIVGAVIVYLRRAVSGAAGYRALAASRRRLGYSLSLSLEFLIGADLLRTAISPSWEDIGRLAAIVGIRVVLNFFLMQELKHTGTEQPGEQ
ncbi:MAG: DUF1622 domain-containing protein [Nitrospirota bacterium]